MLLNAFALFLYVSTIGADRYNWSYPLDLSHPLDENTLTWNPEYNFSLVDKLVIDNPPNFYAANNFVGPEHGGTHLDAPYHFNKKGWKLHEIPLNHLLSPGILVNVSNKVNDNPDFELLPEHLEEWQQNYGAIPKGVIVLVDFGWSKHYGDKLRYFGNTTPPYRCPGISEPAATWLANHEGVHGVGLDTPSLDLGKSKSFPAHAILLGAHIFGLENVAFNGIHLPPKGFFLITLPMKITNGTGAPCRIVAVLPKSVKFNP